MNVVSRLRDLRQREHECTVEIIRQLIVCYETRAYLEHGCSTLFAFLVEELNYSAGAEPVNPDGSRRSCRRWARRPTVRACAARSS